MMIITCSGFAASAERRTFACKKGIHATTVTRRGPMIASHKAAGRRLDGLCRPHVHENRTQGLLPQHDMKLANN